MTRETADCLIQYLFEHWNHDELGITWFGGGTPNCDRYY